MSRHKLRILTEREKQIMAVTKAEHWLVKNRKYTIANANKAAGYAIRKPRGIDNEYAVVVVIKEDETSGFKKFSFVVTFNGRKTHVELMDEKDGL